jgi:hypothetical protein
MGGSKYGTFAPLYPSIAFDEVSIHGNTKVCHFFPLVTQGQKSFILQLLRFK